MNENPFTIDRPAAPEELINREPEWRELLERAHGGHNSRLSAPRRYGKTTLLKKLAVEAEAIGVAPVHVDFLGVLTLDDVLRRVEDGYDRALKGPVGNWFTGVRRKWRPSVRIGTPEASVELQALPQDDAQRALIEALELPRRLFERTGVRHLVVFDEFQAVLTADDGIDGLIRSKIQHHGDAASYVFAGSHPGLMAELFGSRDRPLFAQARPLELGPLSDEHLAEYIGERFGRSGREVGEALPPLLDLVRGHPQRAMLMAHHVWELAAETPADEEVWQEALRTALIEQQDGFERFWDELSSVDRRVLAAVAWIGPWGQGDTLLGRSTLARFKLAKPTAQSGRDALLRRGEIERFGENVRLVDPLLEAWIASGRRPLY